MIQRLTQRRTTVLCALSATVTAFLLGSGCALLSGDRHYAQPAELPPQAGMPDPLILASGRRVESPAQWNRVRRPELKAQFEHYMYGPIPPRPMAQKMSVIAEYPDFLEGQATLKLIRIDTDAESERAVRQANRGAWGSEWSNDGGSPKVAYGSENTAVSIAPYPTRHTQGPVIDLMLVVPNHRLAPAPVFLAMDFCGNQAITTDPRVPLTKSWLPNTVKGVTNNSATEATRGIQAGDWPLREIVRRGYALAAFYSGDIDPDRKDASTGVYAWLAAGDADRNCPTNRGTIAAWAWGFQRCVDYLVTDTNLNSGRIAAVGHSRNGKTALLAAAFDERIAMAFPHQAGCGGSSPSRGTNGESVKVINGNFPHWFNARFKEFNDDPSRLPFDQNALVALCAPRPVLFTAAQGDQWSNPAGQFEVLKAASPAYQFLGVEGMTAAAMPPLNQMVGARLGYYIREGKHSMLAQDWTVFMDFADKQ
jgi:hypothetical protein